MQLAHWSAVAALMAVTACATRPDTPPDPSYTVNPLASGTNAGLRGLSVVSREIVWASGTGGTVLRTTDGGATWIARPVAGADSLDFRDIEAFDGLTAYVLSAGEDGRIYKTTDGGHQWRLQFRNTTPGAFFDCFDFWDERHGIAMSDPVGGRFILLRTDDGETWHELPPVSRPAADSGEAAFAASGTCLLTTADERVLLATGGGPDARVLVSRDRGDSWQAEVTPVAAGAASAGIFSLAFRDADNGIAMGGDYQRPVQQSVVAITTTGGTRWNVAGRTSYVSGAAYGTRALVAVGTRGTRVSVDRGLTWTTIDSLEYNAVQLAADGTGYAVGPRGRIARLSSR